MFFMYLTRWISDTSSTGFTEPGFCAGIWQITGYTSRFLYSITAFMYRHTTAITHSYFISVVTRSKTKNYSNLKTRTKVVHNNVSQGCQKIRKSENKKAKQPLHSIKVALCDLKWFKFCDLLEKAKHVGLSYILTT